MWKDTHTYIPSFTHIHTHTHTCILVCGNIRTDIHTYHHSHTFITTYLHTSIKHACTLGAWRGIWKQSAQGPSPRTETHQANNVALGGLGKHATLFHQQTNVIGRQMEIVDDYRIQQTLATDLQCPEPKGQEPQKKCFEQQDYNSTQRKTKREEEKQKLGFSCKPSTPEESSVFGAPRGRYGPTFPPVEFGRGHTHDTREYCTRKHTKHQNSTNILSQFLLLDHIQGSHGNSTCQWIPAKSGSVSASLDAQHDISISKHGRHWVHPPTQGLAKSDDIGANPNPVNTQQASSAPNPLRAKSSWVVRSGKNHL